MNSIDLTPLYRSTIGFDRMASLLDSGERFTGVLNHLGVRHDVLA